MLKNLTKIITIIVAFMCLILEWIPGSVMMGIAKWGGIDYYPERYLSMLTWGYGVLSCNIIYVLNFMLIILSIVGLILKKDVDKLLMATIVIMLALQAITWVLTKFTVLSIIITILMSVNAIVILWIKSKENK